MLDEVSRGKDLAEKQLIILGASIYTNSSIKSPQSPQSPPPSSLYFHHFLTPPPFMK